MRKIKLGLRFLAIIGLIIIILIVSISCNNQRTASPEPVNTETSSQLGNGVSTIYPNETEYENPTLSITETPQMNLQVEGDLYFWHWQGSNWGISKYSLEEEKITFIVEDVFLTDCELAVTPSGKYLVFSKYVNNDHGITEIYVLDQETQIVRNISNNSNGQNWSPSLSNTGLVAFISSRNDQTDIFLYDLITDDLHQLTDDLYRESDLMISHDGGKIVFTKRVNSKNYLKLYDTTIDKVVLSLEVGEESSYLSDLMFSPDGGYVSFVEIKNQGEKPLFNILNLETLQMITLSEEFDLANFRVSGTGWSQDNSSLMISTEEGATYTRVFLYDMIDDTLTLEYGVLGLAFPARWSQDGNWVAIPSLELSSSSIIFINPKTNIEPIVVFQEDGKFNICGLEWAFTEH